MAFCLKIFAVILVQDNDFSSTNFQSNMSVCFDKFYGFSNVNPSLYPNADCVQAPLQFPKSRVKCLGRSQFTLETARRSLTWLFFLRGIWRKLLDFGGKMAITDGWDDEIYEKWNVQREIWHIYPKESNGV